jgi:tripartite-type tricarboxylate transporter receptor subunit TctC
LASAANAVNATLYDKLNFDFIRDIAQVASIARVPELMEVNPSFPTKTIPEFITYAKANSMALNGHTPKKRSPGMWGRGLSVCRLRQRKTGFI